MSYIICCSSQRFYSYFLVLKDHPSSTFVGIDKLIQRDKLFHLCCIDTNGTLFGPHHHLSSPRWDAVLQKRLAWALINPWVLSAIRVYLGFLLHIFSNFTPPPPPPRVSTSCFRRHGHQTLWLFWSLHNAQQSPVLTWSSFMVSTAARRQLSEVGGGGGSVNGLSKKRGWQYL